MPGGGEKCGLTKPCHFTFREEYRPFAPAILDRHGSEYFEHYQESPYMERTLRFRKEVVDRVPAVACTTPAMR